MSGAAELAGLAPRLRGVRAVVVGDAMLDRYVYGEVDRISPEAPVPVLRVLREASMPGGAGNVARNLAALEARVRFVGVIGEDAAGRELRDLLAAEPAIDAELLTVAGRETGVKTRYVAAAQQLLRADRETVGPPAVEMRDRLVAAAAAALPGCGALVLSDYGKGALEGDVAQRLIAAAAEHGVPAIVDPKGRDYRRYRGAALVTPNRRELAEASGMAVGTEVELVAAARRLRETAGLGAVLVTRSQEGMTLVEAEGAHHLAAEAREVFDVTGAGDTVAAVAGLALGAGLRPIQAARLANAAAGIAVGKSGTATVGLAELEDALRRAGLAAGAGKIVDGGTAARLVGGWRRDALRVGFTNGCFDLLHPGHVSLLAFARAACDRLVVGLNSDPSTRRLKGDGRPVQPETARALVLASLASVDLVVVFEEDTPRALISELRPDVLVKGADYSLDEVVGADIVRGHGGRVLLAPLVEGQSTSRLVAAARR